VRARVGDTRGFTLVEVLLAAVLMLIVLGATLTAIERFWNTNKVNNDLNDAQDVARNTSDQLARQLRNLALPTPTSPNSIDIASSYDLVFKTADPGRRRVRYCLTTDAPAAPDRGRLYMQKQAAAGVGSADPPVPPTTSCPGPTTGSPAWDTATVVADSVVNRVKGDERPVFSFNAPTSPVSELPKITLVRSDIFIDFDTSRRPLESRISTGVYLRNQNQVPKADFSAVSGGTGTRRFILNGSGSSDPEGRTLVYTWFSGPTPDLADTNCASTNAVGCIGDGVTLDYTFPSAAGNGVQTFTLLVKDPGGMTATAKWTCNPTTGACSPS
jgi:prepilin-type N-terminal cleavage/methylation domain-containing protein